MDVVFLENVDTLPLETIKYDHGWMFREALRAILFSQDWEP